ncbi:MAG: FkbM family methyltransferase [Bacteroidales bacterium]|jgi:FkbM family methyltransferase|nr:FkbM family methyltransferase [Bacteroidales bacterium]
MIEKFTTYCRYVKDYIKFNEYYFLFISFQYVVCKKTTKKDRIYKSTLGTFLSRKGSLDFQFANYGYEWNVKSFILNNYNRYTVFLDIGANIGTYSFLLASKGLRCFAFEPVDDNYQAMKVNISLNNMDDKIVAFPYGLGSENRKEHFIFDPLNTGASHRTLYETEEYCRNHHWKMIFGEIKLLDDVSSDLKINKDDRILIKIDTEGMELSVVGGARDFLSQHTDYLIIMETIHSDIHKIKTFFSSIGDFDYQMIDEKNIAIQKVIG